MEFSSLNLSIRLYTEYLFHDTGPGPESSTYTLAGSFEVLSDGGGFAQRSVYMAGMPGQYRVDETVVSFFPYFEYIAPP